MASNPTFAPNVLTPTYNPQEESARRKVAYQLLLQGTSGEPIGAWTQGAARMAQALLGGYDLGQEDKENRQKEAKVAGAVNSFPGMAGGLPQQMSADTESVPTPAPTPRVAMALSGQQAPAEAPAGGSMYGGLPGWKPGERPMYDTATTVQPQTRVAALGNPSVSSDAAPAAAPDADRTQLAQNGQPSTGRAMPTMPPEVQAQIRALWASPQTRPLALQLYEKYSTPKEQYRPATAAERTLYGVSADHPLAIDIATNKPVFGPPQTNISLSTEKKGQEELASKAVGAYVDAQQAARESQKRIALYDRFDKAAEGFRPGASAEIRLGAQRWLKDLGITAGDNVPDGEMMAMIGKQLAIHAQPKGQGSVSNYERSLYAQSLPTMTQSPEGLRTAIGIQRDLEKFDQKTAEIFRDSARKNGGIPNYLEVQDKIAALGSPLSDAQMAAIGRGKTEAPAAKPTGGGKVRKYNPATGKIE